MAKTHGSARKISTRPARSAGYGQSSHTHDGSMPSANQASYYYLDNSTSGSTVMTPSSSNSSHASSYTSMSSGTGGNGNGNQGAMNLLVPVQQTMAQQGHYTQQTGQWTEDQLPYAENFDDDVDLGEHPTQPSYNGQPSHYTGQPSHYNGQPSHYDGQLSYHNGQLSYYNAQPSQQRGQPSPYDGTYQSSPSPMAGFLNQRPDEDAFSPYYHRR